MAHDSFDLHAAFYAALASSIARQLQPNTLLELEANTRRSGFEVPAPDVLVPHRDGLLARFGNKSASFVQAQYSSAMPKEHAWGISFSSPNRVLAPEEAPDLLLNLARALAWVQHERGKQC